MRIEISINGKKRCTAGVAGYGVVNAILTWAKRNPERFDQSKMKYSNLVDFSKETMELSVGGLTSDENESDIYLNWLQEPLRQGDEITIRVLSPGRSDEPSEFKARNA